MRRVPSAAAAAVAAAVWLVAGCGLPLDDGVQSAGQVAPERQRQEAIEVLPPGPQPDADPVALVRGYLAAQTSVVNDHAVARSFLTPAAQLGWDDEAGVEVYVPDGAQLPTEVEGDTAVVRAGFTVVGSVGPDGSAQRTPSRTVQRTYRLAREPSGQWRLSDVPPGLTLSAGDRDRSFLQASVMFLSRGPGPVHLVPDVLLVSLEGDRARRLVDRVVAGPSSALAGSARSAVPPGTRVLRVESSSPGEIVVDLSGEVRGLTEDQRRELSAQLVWTLRQGVPDGFTSLRLLVEGEALEVGGDDGPQARNDYATFDPEGPLTDPEALALAADRVVGVGPQGATGPAVRAELPPVTDAVADARGGGLAVLSGDGDRAVLRAGSQVGPFVVVAEGAGLASPSWGDGAWGVWFLRTGPDGGVVVGRAGGPVSDVAVAGLPPLSAGSVLRLSRDGSRLALVGQDGVLRIGRVEPSDVQAVPRVVDLRPVVSDQQVLDVAWVDGAELVGLVAIDPDDPPPAPLLRLSVDGVVQSLSPLLNGVEESSRTIAAFGERVLVGTVQPPVEVGDQEVLSIYPNRSGVYFPALAGTLSRPRYPG